MPRITSRSIAWLVALALATPAVALVPTSAEAAKPARARKSADKKKPARKKAKTKVKRASKSKDGSRRRREVDDVSTPRPAVLSILDRAIRCPADMVAVAGRICIDRYEMTIADAGSSAAWPPFYTPDLARAKESYDFYVQMRERAAPGSLGGSMAVPPPPAFQLTPKAVSAAGVLPQGYMSGDQAALACAGAGKRLCTEAEWLTACLGEDAKEFPYGPTYEQGACNVYRENHPSSMLHGNASKYHDDPRNNLVAFEGKLLLKKTGSSPRCASKWGEDAIMDMVGNLDEWVDDKTGVFVGGFYSRGTRAGCFARVSNHVRTYSDYSTGARCCADPLADP